MKDTPIKKGCPLAKRSNQSCQLVKVNYEKVKSSYRLIKAQNDGRILAELGVKSFIHPELFTKIFRGLESKYDLFEKAVLVESYLNHKLGEVE